MLADGSFRVGMWEEGRRIKWLENEDDIKQND